MRRKNVRREGIEEEVHVGGSKGRRHPAREV
jgi:hypothetical protein